MGRQIDIGENLMGNTEQVYECVEGLVRIRPGEIVYLESDRHQITIHTMGGDYHIYRRLREFEDELHEFGFLRIHKSFLVNMTNVRQIRRYAITLDNGISLPVSKMKYNEVKSRLKQGCC